jgi:integrase
VDGRVVYLGRWGTPESHAKFERVLRAWREAAAAGLPAVTTRVEPAVYLVAHLARDFLADAAQTRVEADGVTPKREVEGFIDSLMPLLALHGPLPAAEYTSLHLEELQKHMLRERGWARTLVNQRVGRVKRAFKWAARKLKVPLATYQGLTTVEDVRRGAPGAREGRKVVPVPYVRVEATLPFLTPVLRAAVLVQYHGAMRPGEALALRPGDVWKDSYPDGRPFPVPGVWLYLPGSYETRGEGPGAHKTAWRGHGRQVWLGPRAREALAPYLAGRAPGDCCFSPAEAMRDFRAVQKAAGSQGPAARRPRRRAFPKKKPGRRYTHRSLDQAVAKACLKAFPPPAPLARRKVPAPPGSRRPTRWETLAEWKDRCGPELEAWLAGHHWHPHQLRHAKGSEVEEAEDLAGGDGVRSARLVMGQRSERATLGYVHHQRAERDSATAAALAARLG